MCYRYSVPGPKALEEEFHAEFLQKEKFARTYHVSSFDLPHLPIITNDDPEHIQLFVWGLIPFWVKKSVDAEDIRLKTMNARAESLYEKPAFRRAAAQKRCLVLTDGFYEWREYHGRNYPYYIRLTSHKPFAMAGLWDTWENKETQEKIHSYTVITTKANPLMELIHNKKKRMPVILRKKDESPWLTTASTKESAEPFLQPFDETKMEAYTISRLITSKQGNPNVPEVMRPVTYPELGSDFAQQQLI